MADRKKSGKGNSLTMTRKKERKGTRERRKKADGKVRPKKKKFGYKFQLPQKLTEIERN